MVLHPGLHILTCSCCWRASSICWRCFSIWEAASFFCSSWAAKSCSRRLMSCVIMVESCRSFSARLSGVPGTKQMQSKTGNKMEEKNKQSTTLHPLPAVRRKSLHLMLHQPDVPHLLNIVSIPRQRSVFLETEQQTKQVLENRALLIDLRFSDIKSSHNQEAPGISKFFPFFFKRGQDRASKCWASSTSQSSEFLKTTGGGPGGSVKAENGVFQTTNGKASLKVRRSQLPRSLFPLLVIAASQRDGEEWNCSY